MTTEQASDKTNDTSTKLEDSFDHKWTENPNGEPAWGDVDKTALPAGAFAYVPDAEKRSTWKLPHHTKGGFAHRGGVAAAYAAIKGARGNKAQVDQKAIDHIEEHRKAMKMGPYAEESAGVREALNAELQNRRSSEDALSMNPVHTWSVAEILSPAYLDESVPSGRYATHTSRVGDRVFANLSIERPESVIQWTFGRGKTMYVAHCRNSAPKNWLDLHNENFVSEGVYQLGIVTEGCVEYFLDGHHVIFVMDNDGQWYALNDDLEPPLVMNSDTVPPMGRSGLPVAMECLVPVHFKWWDAPTADERVRLRDGYLQDIIAKAQQIKTEQCACKKPTPVAMNTLDIPNTSTAAGPVENYDIVFPARCATPQVQFSKASGSKKTFMRLIHNAEASLQAPDTDLVPVQDNVPFESVEPELIISGMALHEGVFNDMHFEAKELAKGYATMRNVPLRLDHIGLVSAIVGVVTNVTYDEKNKEIDFEAEVDDAMTAKRVKRGLVKGVSVGAFVAFEVRWKDENGKEQTLKTDSWWEAETVRQEHNAEVYPVDLEFVELTLTTNPACVDCGIDTIQTP